MKRGTFKLPCGCHLRKTARGHAWKQCDLHKAAPEMLKALDRVLFACRTGGGVLGWDLFYKCGDAVNELISGGPKITCGGPQGGLQKQVADDRRLRSKAPRPVNNRAA
jgi:hypothetical protein